MVEWIPPANKAANGPSDCQCLPDGSSPSANTAAVENNEATENTLPVPLPGHTAGFVGASTMELC